MNTSITSRFTDFILFGYFRSSCAWRCRIVLNYLEIPYENISIHLVKEGGMHLKDEYKLINPAQRVPTLQFKDNSKGGDIINLTESSAIIEFLIENFSEGKSLLPEDAILKAKTRAMYNHISCNIQPLQNLVVINKVSEIGGDKMNWANYWINRGLENLEELVKETKGKYCVNDQFTLADVYLVPQIFGARRFKVDINKFPNLIEIEANLNKLDCVIKAAPENQPDFEP
jgi:maleylacetoacetate isomerase